MELKGFNNLESGRMKKSKDFSDAFKRTVQVEIAGDIDKQNNITIATDGFDSTIETNMGVQMRVNAHPRYNRHREVTRKPDY